MASNSLGPTGGTGGTATTVEVPQGVRVTSVHITYGDHLYGVLFSLSSGETVQMAGDSLGQITAVTNLKDGVTIQGFTGNYGDDTLNQITLLTSDGNSYGPYGGSAGTATFEFNVPTGCTFAGLCGRAGAWIDAFGIMISDCQST